MLIQKRYGRSQSLLLALLLGLGLLVLGQAPTVPAATVTYTAEITGVSDASLLYLLTTVSDTLAPDAAPPASALHLRRRAERDESRFLEVFYSQGYYGASIDLQIDRDAAPMRVTFAVTLDERYVFGDIAVLPVDADLVPPGTLPAPEAIGLRPGAPALADTIAGSDARILTHLREQGYPSPSIALRDVVVHHDSKSVAISYRVDTGSPARYGELRLSGLEAVRPEAVEKFVPWDDDAIYDEREVTMLRRRLYNSGLFSTVTVTPVTDAMTADGHVPLLADLTERAHRTAALGLEYKTDTGAGTHARWEHRNMRGLGHRLQLDATLGTELRELQLQYRIEHYRRYDQFLTVTSGVAQEEREAYDSERITLLAMVDRKVSERLTLGVGAGFRVGRVEQRGVEDSHQLLHFPLLASWDRSNDPLNPSAGFRINTRIEPFAGLFGEQSLFIKGHAEVTYYLGFGTWEAKDGRSLDNWVLATRMKLGALMGEERDAVPADLRFYGGGGGSIRGYAYQTVSPLSGDVPLGGRSLAETSLELRKRLTDTIGMVAFIDGGSAFESAYPDFSADLKFGAGVGLRYYTPLGPLRFDIAVPLDRRGDLDDAYQIYLSIGQAF